MARFSGGIMKLDKAKFDALRIKTLPPKPVPRTSVKATAKRGSR